MIGRLSGRQADYITGLLKQLGISERTALYRCPGITHDHPGGPPAAVRDLTMQQASNLLDWLIAIREGHKPMPAPLGQASMFADGASEPVSHEGRWSFEEVRTYHDDSVYGNGYDSITSWRIYLADNPSHTVATSASYITASRMVAIHNQAISDGAA